MKNTKRLAFAVLILAFWISLPLRGATSNVSCFVSFTSQASNTQRPLSFNQIEELALNQTPDTAIAIEIERRGIDFNPTKQQLERLSLIGAGPKTIGALKNRQIVESGPPPVPGIAESDFTDVVLRSQIPVLVFFCADSRTGCKETAPAVAEIAQTYKDKIKVVKVDTYINQHIPAKYNAGYFKGPVIVLFNSGTEQGRIVGTASKQSIIRLIEKPSDFKVAKPSELSVPTILESDFKSEVLEAKEPTLVFFCTISYTSCDATLSSVASIAEDYKGKIKVVMVDVRINRRLAKEYEAEEFYTGPVIILFSGGKERARIIGSASKEAIARLIENPSDFKNSPSLGSDNVLRIVESDFDLEVLKSKIPALVFFCTAKSEACKLTAPAVAEIADIYKVKIKVFNVDADINRNISTKYAYEAYYRSTPVLILFNRGKERSRIEGTASKDAIARMIDKILNSKK